MDTLAKVAVLARGGRFKEALRALDQAKPASKVASQVLRIELLERLGSHDECRVLVKRLLDSKGLTESQRATCQYVEASLLLERGDTEGATTHLQRATSLARQALDLHLLCNIQMKQLGILADLSGPDSIAPVLADLRLNAIRLGDPWITAAMHIFVAQMEASRGLFRSAGRHLRLANSLIDEYSNPWLSAHSDNILLAVCVLRSDIEQGHLHAERGRQNAEECGAAAVRRAISANQALLFLLAGELPEALESVNRALLVVESSGERRNGCLDTIARIHLAEGALDECRAALDLIDDSIKTAADRRMYANRFALLTRGQLLACEGALDKALAQLTVVQTLAAQTDDKLLLENVRLSSAELLGICGRRAESLNALESLSDHVQELSPELYVQYERMLACSLRDDGDIRMATRHYRRAQRIAGFIKNAPAQMDLERRWNERQPTADGDQESDRSRAESATALDSLHSLAAIFANLGRAEFIGREIVELLAKSCAPYFVQIRRVALPNEVSRVVYQTENKLVDDGGAVIEKTYTIQATPTHRVELSVAVRATLHSVAALNSLSTIISTLHDLDRARAEREERATIWPADDVVFDGDTSVLTGHMREIMSQAQRVARADVVVLITGESGTGKEIVARALHAYSSRAQKPFVAFNCAAIPRDLVESQLFGHRRGAFTGADRDFPGVIRAARDGTLFLDEIGDLSLDLQPKLLRFLESKEIAPLGDPATHRVDVRIVAATNANLEDAVHAGRFREDLFYRLNVVPIPLKPLRERRDEIPALINAFVERAAKEFHKGHLEVAEETIERLLLYRWPGNVRQLQNELRRMVALTEPNSTIEPDLISREIIEAMPIFRHDPANRRELAVRLSDKLTPTLIKVECEMIKAALRDNQGKVDAVARALGISRKGLYLKRQRHGL